MDYAQKIFADDPQINHLPCDGIVNYFGRILPAARALELYQALLDTICWKHDEAIIRGRHISVARQVAWYGDADYAYTYSGITKHALMWNRELREIKTLVEQMTGTRFNSCLLNLYRTGDEGMTWHSDDEYALGTDTTIASVSLGAERKFSMKHKRMLHATSIHLEHGSLLVMRGTTQTHWLHCVPKSKRIISPRINLTFRTIHMPGTSAGVNLKLA